MILRQCRPVSIVFVRIARNGRYYQHHEVQLIRRIRELLYEEGFTLSGARQRLEQAQESSPRTVAPTNMPSAFMLREELSEILKILK